MNAAALRLLELDTRYKLLKPGLRVLAVDVPTSWLKIISQCVDSSVNDKRVLAVSDKPIAEMNGVRSLEVDFDSDWFTKKHNLDPFDLAVSYVHTRGEDWECLSLKASLEHVKSMHFMKSYLKPGAKALMKMYAGPNEASHFALLSKHFKEIQRVKEVGGNSSNYSFYYLASGWNLAAPSEPQEEDVETLMRLAKAGEVEYSSELVLKVLGKEKGQRFISESSTEAQESMFNTLMPKALYKVPENLDEMVEISKEIELYMQTNTLVHTDSEDIEEAQSKDLDKLLKEIDRDSDADEDELLENLNRKMTAESILTNDMPMPPSSKQELDDLADRQSNKRLSKRDFERWTSYKNRK